MPSWIPSTKFIAIGIACTALGLALRPEYATQVRRFTHAQLARMFVAATVVGLLIWEVLQRGSAGLQFDWRDMAATLVGGGVCGLGAVRLLRAPPATP
jgi:hypothetical protein